MTKKIKSVHCHFLVSRVVLPARLVATLTPVHINFWLKGILDSGAATSGRRGVKGLIKSRNRTD